MNVGNASTLYLRTRSFFLVAVDRADRVAGVDQLGDRRAHRPAGRTPFGVEVEQDGLAATGRRGRRDFGRRGDQGEDQAARVMSHGLLLRVATRYLPPGRGTRAGRASSRAGRASGAGLRASAGRAGRSGPDKHAIRIGSGEPGCASRRGRSSPAHPWAGRASRGPRALVMRGRVPPAVPGCVPLARDPRGPIGGAMVATSPSLRPPARSLGRDARTEGEVSTAVALIRGVGREYQVTSSVFRPPRLQPFSRPRGPFPEDAPPRPFRLPRLATPCPPTASSGFFST